MMKFLRHLLLVALSLNCTACGEFFWGLGCTAGIVFTRDKKFDIVELPTAVVGQYYEYTITCESQGIGDCHYMDWMPDLAKKEFPQGLELVSVSIPRLDDDGQTSSQNAWMIQGTPVEPGNYKFNIIGYTYRSMCGKSDDIYRYKINIVQAASPSEG